MTEPVTRQCFEAESVDCAAGGVVVRWRDGHESFFHHIWLRDSCTCTTCGDTSTGVRFLRLTDIPEQVSPDAVRLTGSGRVEITWSPDGHVTVLGQRWLREHCYTRRERLRRRFQSVLWGSEIAGCLPRMACDVLFRGDEELWHAYRQLRDFGFLLIQGVAPEAEGTEAVVRLFGYIQETNYGRMIELATDSTFAIDGNTQMGLPPHTDEAFRYAPPGISFLHMITPSPDGGGQTTLVDGFRVAEVLREQEPEAFKILAAVPQQFHRFIEGNAALRADGTAIVLDQDHQVVGVRFGDRNTAPLDVPEHLVEPVYAARRALLGVIYASGSQARIGLSGGDLLLFDNHRVLHGRTPFNVGNGVRRIRQGAVDREEFHSRFRLLSLRFSPDSTQTALPRGAL